MRQDKNHQAQENSSMEEPLPFRLQPVFLVHLTNLNLMDGKPVDISRTVFIVCLGGTRTGNIPGKSGFDCRFDLGSHYYSKPFKSPTALSHWRSTPGLMPLVCPNPESTNEDRLIAEEGGFPYSLTHSPSIVILLFFWNPADQTIVALAANHGPRKYPAIIHGLPTLSASSTFKIGRCAAYKFVLLILLGENRQQPI
jgi:hypothetical protein